jgi:glycine oxidase
MSNGSDVVVIGGGAMGAATARALARGGARVTIVARRGTEGEGWRAAAGMLAAQVEAEPDDPIFALGVAGRAFYRREAEALREATGIDIALQQTGILQVAFSEQRATAFKAKVAWQRQQAYRADWLEPDEVREGWPWLEPGVGAFSAAEDGSLDPVALVEALLADAVASGATVVDDLAVGLDRHGGALHGVIGTAGRYAADTVVIAGGAWSGRLDQLPRPLSVEPIRGQMAAFHWPRKAPPAVVYGERCYLLRRGDELIAGSTMEHAGFDVRTTPEGLAGLIERVAMLYPALRDATPLRTWAGLRPGTPDGLPIIGPEPRCAGLWYATGHGRNGILLAGITGERVAQAIGGEPLPEKMLAFRPERFWDW